MNIETFIIWAFLIGVIFCCVMIIADLRDARIGTSETTPSITGSAPISTEEYFNNCSNNWTFVKCDWRNGVANCTADDRPIHITGWVPTQ